MDTSGAPSPPSPGAAGDFLATRATAIPVDSDADAGAGSGADAAFDTGTRADVLPGDRFALHGEKHFGSGSQLVSFMVTTARIEGVELPAVFAMDLRDQPWDGTSGLRITREWDGMGMKATQSHAVLLDGVEGTPMVWPDALIECGPAVSSLALSLFSAVVSAICDAAMAEAERRLGGRPLRPYEDVALTQAQVDHWMLTQAMHGLSVTIGRDPTPVALVAATKAKLGMAALAEKLLSELARAVGGGAFSASSPFAAWYEDVRALGYLRPPWALSFDQLSEARAAAGG